MYIYRIYVWKDIAAHQATSSLKHRDPFLEECSVEFMKDMPAADMEARSLRKWPGMQHVNHVLTKGQSSGTRPGKHTKNYGTSTFLMGKSTISMAIFNSKLLVYQRVFPVENDCLNMS